MPDDGPKPKGRSMSTQSEALARIEAKDILRFFRKVSVCGPAQCWTWIACKNKDGYGWFALGRTPVCAHRFSHQIVHGSPAPGNEIRHTCNNPACVNPNHLIEGTHLENMRDRDATGWKPSARFSGESNPAAKLSDMAVREIRRMRSESTISCKKIGAVFGVSGATVARILNGKIWGHV